MLKVKTITIICTELEVEGERKFQVDTSTTSNDAAFNRAILEHVLENMIEDTNKEVKEDEGN